jgi:DNA helicase-2/ATP-dependent DNA helicase PcrA
MLTRLERNDLEDKIKVLHSGDEKQLEVIFSQSKRLVVEAPAGYGKTKTMISKIAYMLATSQIKNPKKILALTFSVNAAYKIKKDVAEQLPNLLQTKTSRFVKPQEKLFISNYHGFCRHILKLYGYLLHGSLTDIDTLKTVDDSNNEELGEITRLDYDDLKIFDEYSKAVKSVNREYLNNNYNLYIEKLNKSF